jgi:hypothetical protein
MKKLILLILLGACSSLHKEVFSKVHEGDSEESVVEKFGTPDSFEPVPGVKDVKILVYKKKSDTCAIAVKNKVVQDTACQEDQRKRTSVLGAFLTGMGDGLKNSSSRYQPAVERTVNCTTTHNGGIDQTTCN